jgi:hypothetical protein
LFWDTNLDSFNPCAYPAYTIARVLEYGDQEAVVWLKEAFTEFQIVEVLRTEQRLSRKSATFWGLVYHVPPEEIAALRRTT